MVAEARLPPLSPLLILLALASENPMHDGPDMKASLLTLSLFIVGSLHGGPFPSEPQVLTPEREFTLRGVVNLAILPVLDDFETAPTQSGFFLFTPDPHRATFEEDGNRIEESNLTLFHLTGTDAILADLEKSAGKPVEVVAMVIPAHTRYHRTPVILNVKSFRILSE